MVFCYKIITETPRKSGHSSPRRHSPVRKLPNAPSSLSQLVGTFDYENDSVLDSIPEREWRLLAALARKREEEAERENLADQFRKLWQKEKHEREIVEAESSHQYKQYINHKRQQERSWNEYKRLQMSAEQQVKRGQLMDCIRHKDRKTQELLAWREDQKNAELVDKAIEDEARAILATERRCRQLEAAQWRRNMEAQHTARKARDAKKKRSAMLRDSTQRLAISNALSMWESNLLRQDILALEEFKRANHAAHAALTEQRSAAIAREKERRLKRARRMAAITAQMREVLKSGGVSNCQ